MPEGRVRVLFGIEMDILVVAMGEEKCETYET